ncbi:gluconate 2-dehydrogenase subunit 3 family protein [Mucilaginibacter aquaedulcis]|uniref:gluconate 2-dehydrogenase subunit 3 family protein n=1 Tax=Mucilaginibacter aquaedulcis TaxID=1187081 RepID=UPI0025B621BB|nr:gluconate 2-dehydrogenase subunit 3 family protein [Mucilaginibacter aquaedulcis]MDN3548268.1 gluconate 2-dehydrogenase subunit 3 family protein [Mucilaginibacter aquaedulcis]
MNRRRFTKNILIAGALGLTSYPIFKWVSINKNVSPDAFRPYANLIDELAETIIPRTDTPGAKDAKVGSFITKMLVSCTDNRTQNIFLQGLNDLEEYAHDKYNHSFLECSKTERLATLEHFEQKSTYRFNVLNKIENKFIGLPFILNLKRLTVQGYCTSQVGVTKGMAYELIPVHFQACIPLTPGQKSWATK